MRYKKSVTLASLFAVLIHTQPQAKTLIRQASNLQPAGQQPPGSDGRFGQKPGVPSRFGNRNTNTLAIGQNQQRMTYVLNGESLTVSGNNNDIDLRGKCSKLTVSGSGNIIHIQSVSVIYTTGNRNEIIWRTGNPSVSNLGSANNIISRD